MEASNSKKVRALILAVAVAFALSVFLSLDFTAKNLDHHCSCSGGCSICFVLQIADEIISGVKKATKIRAVFSAIAISVVFVKIVKQYLFSVVTPVQLGDVLTI